MARKRFPTCAVRSSGRSTALDALFDPRHAHRDFLSRARSGVLSAPQGNRCYLPAEGAAIIPGLLSRFAAEFEEQIQKPGRKVAPPLIPKIADWNEASRNFVLDERQQSKRPDWTYAASRIPLAGTTCVMLRNGRNVGRRSTASNSGNGYVRQSNFAYWLKSACINEY